MVWLRFAVISKPKLEAKAGARRLRRKIITHQEDGTQQTREIIFDQLEQVHIFMLLSCCCLGVVFPVASRHKIWNACNSTLDVLQTRIKVAGLFFEAGMHDSHLQEGGVSSCQHQSSDAAYLEISAGAVACI